MHNAHIHSPMTQVYTREIHMNVLHNALGALMKTHGMHDALRREQTRNTRYAQTQHKE